MVVRCCGAGVGWPYGAQYPGRPVVGDAGDGDVLAVEGADEHAGERVEVGVLREAVRQRLPEQRPSRLDDAGPEEVEQFGVAFLLGEQ
jgi:hypothetical protein